MEASRRGVVEVASEFVYVEGSMGDIVDGYQRSEVWEFMVM